MCSHFSGVLQSFLGQRAFDFTSTVQVWTALLSALFVIAAYFLYKRGAYYPALLLYRCTVQLLCHSAADKRSALAIGMLIGVSFMMAMQHLTLAIYAAALAADDSSTHGEQDSERALTAFAILLMMADLFMCGLVATSTNVLLPSSSEAMNPAPPAATAAADSAHYNGSGYDTGKLTDTTAADTYEGAPDGSDAADVEVQADTAV